MRSERRNLGQRTFCRLQIRSTEIQRITLLSDTNCLWELRMDRNVFAMLCELLKTRGGLLDDGNVIIEEQVATFVNILAHHTKNKSVQVRFYRSGETISRYVHRVLRALLHLENVLFVKPTPVPNDFTDSRWRWFKGCLRALDETYIEVTIPESDKPRYRTRKGHIATNVLGVCTRELKFVYVLSGWEGSVTDSRVLRDAITRHNGLKISFADVGYTNGQCFLAPYRGTRYHLQEWEDFDRAPRNHEEYFNMKHTQARNIIERCFGLLKKRWAILRSPSFYPIRFQERKIIACALLHNFIRMYMDVDPEEYTSITLDELPIGEDIPDELESIDVVEASDECSQWRDDLPERCLTLGCLGELERFMFFFIIVVLERFIRNWTPEEEDVMITILEGIVADCGRCDTGSFRHGETSKRKRKRNVSSTTEEITKVFEKSMERAYADIAKLTEAITGGDAMTHFGVELED
ncbi:hypothetical protein Ddye_002486 [Dipteronia dyeriana]|uniref:DDE Tnp4 domain-containing protein n=1 Tax=Dipteronia dyeriana TaxID=168575 RepID=A0AAE0CUF7_9ROSI|nr:hypothetical protein Ddye_002486 [Dipteronia dyeriana]